MRLLNLDPVSAHLTKDIIMREDQKHGKPSSKNKTGDNQQNLKKYPVKTSWKPNMVSIEWLIMKMVAYFLKKNN